MPLPATLDALMSVIDLLPSDAHLITLPEGEVMFAQGDRGELMYVVAEGEAQILLEGKVVETVGPGGILGEMALIDAEARSAIAITKTRCVLIPIDEKGFTDLVTRQPEFALQVMRVLAYRLRMMDLQR
jgi:CRP/FNR family cyclic AMP-dependent transcriptional regulator